MMKLTKIHTCWTTYGGVMEPHIRVSDYKVTSDGYFGHEEHEIEIEVTEPGKADAVQAAVAELQAQQAKHRAEIGKIEERIKSLLCIEHKVAA